MILKSPIYNSNALNINEEIENVTEIKKISLKFNNNFFFRILLYKWNKKNFNYSLF